MTAQTDVDVVRDGITALRLGITEHERRDAGDTIEHASLAALDRLQARMERLEKALTGPVHNHGPHEGPGMSCHELRIGACIADQALQEQDQP